MADTRSHITDTRYTFVAVTAGTKYHIAPVRRGVYVKHGTLCGNTAIVAGVSVDRSLVHEGSLCAKCIRSAKLARLTLTVAPAPDKEEAPAP